MKIRLVGLASAAVLGALAGASGCVDNRASIQIQMICVPPAPTTTDTSCGFSGKCTKEYAGDPILDRGTAGTTGYGPGSLLLYLQVANQLPNNADSVGRTNTNNAHVDEIAATIEGATVADYSIGGNGMIPAAGTSVVAVPIVIAGGGTGEALAKIRLRGYYDNGSRFETGEFPITILLCSGCVANPLCDAGAPTCPEGGEGQRPLTCGQAPTTTP